MDNRDFTTPGDYEKIAVSNASKGLTSAKINVGRDSMAIISVETDSVRWRCDGEAPTDAEGILMSSGDSLVLSGKQSLVNFRMIRCTTDASVKVQYFHQL